MAKTIVCAEYRVYAVTGQLVSNPEQKATDKQISSLCFWLTGFKDNERNRLPHRFYPQYCSLRGLQLRPIFFMTLLDGL